MQTKASHYLTWGPFLLHLFHSVDTHTTVLTFLKIPLLCHIVFSRPVSTSIFKTPAQEGALKGTSGLSLLSCSLCRSKSLPKRTCISTLLGRDMFFHTHICVLLHQPATQTRTCSRWIDLNRRLAPTGTEAPRTSLAAFMQAVHTLLIWTGFSHHTTSHTDFSAFLLNYLTTWHH